MAQRVDTFLTERRVRGRAWFTVPIEIATQDFGSPNAIVETASLLVTVSVRRSIKDTGTGRPEGLSDPEPEPPPAALLGASCGVHTVAHAKQAK